MSGKHRPEGSAEEHERFARALEASSPASFDSPSGGDLVEDGDEFGAELALVELLRSSREQLGADELARARMRSRVLDSTAPGRHVSGSGARAGSRRHSLRGRLAVSAAAVLCFALVLGGLGALVSRNAVPGDPLYGVKLSMQQASVDLAGDDMSKGVRYTELASARIAEAKQLLESGGAEVHDYQVALEHFDSDARAAADHFTRVENGPRTRALTELHGWAAQSAARLSALREDIPQGARDRAVASIGMLRRIGHRAHVLLSHAPNPAGRPSGEDAQRAALPDAPPPAPSASPSESPAAPSQPPDELPTQRVEDRTGGGAPTPGAPASPAPSQVLRAPEPAPSTSRSPEPPQPGLDLSPRPNTDAGHGSDHARTPEAGRDGLLGGLLGGGLGLLGGG